MPKISRKELQKTTVIAHSTGKQFVEFVKHCKKLDNFFLEEIEALKTQVKELQDHLANLGLNKPVKPDAPN